MRSTFLIGTTLAALLAFTSMPAMANSVHLNQFGFGNAAGGSQVGLGNGPGKGEGGMAHRPADHGEGHVGTPAQLHTHRQRVDDGSQLDVRWQGTRQV